jgi:hypothetical protein
MTRFTYLATAFAALLALSAPGAHAGIHFNGPALDGRQVALPLDGARFEPMAEPPKE